MPTSKKNHDTRRKELLQYMVMPLEQLCLQHTDQLARSLAGSRVLQHVYTNGSSEALREKLVSLCIEPNTDNQTTTLLEDPVGHYLVKHLVLEHATFAHDLAEALDLDTITSSRAAFVVAALCKTAERKHVVPRITKTKVQATMQQMKNKDDKVATAGFEALLKTLLATEE